MYLQCMHTCTCIIFVGDKPSNAKCDYDTSDDATTSDDDNDKCHHNEMNTCEVCIIHVCSLLLVHD